jgi:hypothetical protein
LQATSPDVESVCGNIKHAHAGCRFAHPSFLARRQPSHASNKIGIASDQADAARCLGVRSNGGGGTADRTFDSSCDLSQPARPRPPCRSALRRQTQTPLQILGANRETSYICAPQFGYTPAEKRKTVADPRGTALPVAGRPDARMFLPAVRYFASIMKAVVGLCF